MHSYIQRRTRPRGQGCPCIHSRGAQPHTSPVPADGPGSPSHAAMPMHRPHSPEETARSGGPDDPLLQLLLSSSSMSGGGSSSSSSSPSSGSKSGGGSSLSSSDARGGGPSLSLPSVWAGPLFWVDACFFVALFRPSVEHAAGPSPLPRPCPPDGIRRRDEEAICGPSSESSSSSTSSTCFLMLLALPLLLLASLGSDCVTSTWPRVYCKCVGK